MIISFFFHFSEIAQAALPQISWYKSDDDFFLSFAAVKAKIYIICSSFNMLCIQRCYFFSKEIFQCHRASAGSRKKNNTLSSLLCQAFQFPIFNGV